MKLLLVLMLLVPFASVTLVNDGTAKVEEKVATASAIDFQANVGSPVITAALPPAPALKGNDPGTHVEEIVSAVHNKEWGVVIGLVLMFVVYMIGFFWQALPSAWLPWVSVFLGVITTSAIDLAAGHPWWRSVLSGFTTGSSATGFWELIGKKLVGSRTGRLDAKEEEAPE